jgi:acyl-CoA dehydrogenase family protein 9
MDKTPSSFSKSLFFGHIPEEMVIPYPTATPAERTRVREILAALAELAKGANPAAIDAAAAIPPELLADLRQRGFFGLSVPTEHGGLGLSMTGYARVAAQLAGFDASVAVTLSGHEALGLRGLLLHGTAEQRRRYLPDLARGEKIAAFALTEPGSGSDAASIQMRATPQPDGSFILDGDKTWIVNGGIADLFTIFAQTEVERGGERKNRITAFLVERGMGVQPGPEEAKLGVRGASTTSLALRQVRVPPENVLGQVGGGFKVAMGVLNVGRLSSAAGTVGAAQELIRLALAHAVKRRQFGRPISEFGMVKDKIGRMMMDVFAAESMVYLTTGMVDRGVQDCSLESAICKVSGSEMLWRVAHESAAIAAGAGYMSGHPWERLIRDARVNLVFQGTNEILRCFIALSGMQGPGERLAQLAQFIKWPLKGYGLAIDFVVDKLKTQYVGNGATVEHAHGMLKRETVLFEDNVPELAKQVEKTLRKHGKEISEMQYVQRRVADMTIDLYMMIACIARTTAAILEKGAPAAEREAKLCRAVCGRAAQRIRRNIRMFDDNDDELVKAVAKDAYDAGCYDFDVVLG